MRIDILKNLAPNEYKFRQLVLDTMFRIAKTNPNPTCHQDELLTATKAKKEKMETVILYLVRNDYMKHVGDHGEPLYALTEKGQTASIDKEFFRTGRNERYKTFQVYASWIGLVGSILGILSMLISLTLSNDLSTTTKELEQRLQSIEAQISNSVGSTPIQSAELTTEIVVDTIPSE